MEGKININIAAILKDKPQNTRLWSPIFGEVYLKDVTDVNNNMIRITHHGVDNIFMNNGKVWADGDVCLFPSRWMNDWQKFAWKKGNVLVSNDGKQECIFDGWYNKDYTQARVKYWLDISNENNIKCLEENQPLTSVMFKQEDKEKIECYINTIEEWYGGKKLNRETLEIEPQVNLQHFADNITRIVYVETKEGDRYIGQILFVNPNEGRITIGNQLYWEKVDEDPWFVTDEASDLTSQNIKVARFATKEENELFCREEAKAKAKTKKPKKETPPMFELGKLYVFNEQDEDGELTIIGNLIGKNENYDTLTFGNQYEIETEKFVTDHAFDLQISVHEELREATESETTVFQKAYTQWLEKEKKAMRAKEQPVFKPFDKVLVRNGDNNKWQPAFISRDRGESSTWRYEVLLINSGKSDSFTSCIPFEGNEDIAFTDHDYMPF